MSKKICMVVAYHPFMDARIFKKEAKSLQKKGYSVTMIVPRKNGNLFDIDGSPFKKQFRNKVFTHEGIKFVTYNSESSKRQLNKVLSDESVWESQGFTNPLTQLAIKENADIYHTHEYLSLFAGVGIKRLMKKVKGKEVKLIYDSHELTPDPLHPRYSEEKRKLLKQKLLTMLKEVDYVITVSDSIKSWYLSHLPKLPVEVIYNSPPLAKDYLVKDYSSNGLIIGYEGNIDDKKGSKEKIFGISEICSKKIDFQFKIIGGSRYGDSVLTPEHLRSNINLIKWVDYHSIPKYLKDVDIGWIDLEDVEYSLNRTYSLPNKFFSYLNNGIPVVVNKCHEMEGFIRTHQCGYVVDKTNATSQDFADALLSLHDNKNKLKEMSKNGRKVMENLYSWEKMEERLFTIYQQLQTN
ncbi:glycosyltransferase involved in cell wall biosynthesis [Virgibacillus natechei]|uniref:Glycosyltransferase involved in cell wall biosynthesis n=1 Tax=Virgibacillus natechei TaxID=1216297 RepID=A0ABS4IC82_9BACI|nr:glycosyltransferase [Virgibacillus natechei]MBP1968453.1 glycosyltransferase involved in cell wall biosynthesis [Virgibacillus natechei]UZD13574.1 glycosyltransferase [Virgibacillus natechei]